MKLGGAITRFPAGLKCCRTISVCAYKDFDSTPTPLASHDTPLCIPNITTSQHHMLSELATVFDCELLSIAGRICTQTAAPSSLHATPSPDAPPFLYAFDDGVPRMVSCPLYLFTVSTALPSRPARGRLRLHVHNIRARAPERLLRLLRLLRRETIRSTAASLPSPLIVACRAALTWTSDDM
jgi:hypothetical protein